MYPLWSITSFYWGSNIGKVTAHKKTYSKDLRANVRIASPRLQTHHLLTTYLNSILVRHGLSLRLTIAYVEAKMLKVKY